jgi:hypothetical protein
MKLRDPPLGFVDEFVFFVVVDLAEASFGVVMDHSELSTV